MAGVGKVYGKVKPPQVFVDAVSKVMREWQAIKIAVDNMFGGPLSKEKAQWMEEVTVDFMCNNIDVQSWELEDYLCVLMDQEFHTSVEDASLPMIAKKICELYADYQSGNIQKIQDFISKSRSPVPSVQVQCVEEDEKEEVNGLEVVEEEESDSEGIQEDLEQLKLNEQTSPKKEPIASVPDDGSWEVVKRSRRKSKNS